MSADCDIQIPATEQQIAEAIRWAADSDANIIRRLAFERDRLRDEIATLRRENAELESVCKDQSDILHSLHSINRDDNERRLQDGIRSREQGWG